jgi:tRNA threonylcarbamoyladenosine biosynthesis protein TsaE
MINRQYNISSLESLSSVTKDLLRLSNNRIFALYGKMGVGKTTLFKSFCDHLNVVDSISSPTFSIVNEYMTLNAEKVFHFDFYRLNDVKELDSIGVETYFNSGCYCFIEWPELIEPFLSMNYHIIKLSNDQNYRELVLIK